MKPAQASSSVATYDATAAAAEIGKRGRFAPWASALIRFSNAQSAKFDLRMAELKMEAFMSMISGIRPNEKVDVDYDVESTAGSLFSHALVLYARATDTGGVRGQMRVDRRWPEETRKVHRHLIDLRNRFVAHFEFGHDQKDGPWARDRVFFVEENGVFAGYRDQQKRVNFKENDLRDLMDMLPLALSAMDEIIQERFDAFLKSSSSFTEAEARQLAAIIAKHRVDDAEETRDDRRFPTLIDGLPSTYTVRQPAAPKPERP